MTDAQARPRLLVVDDDPGIREVLCEYLDRHGYAAEPAASAAEMDRALQARPADLVVLDVMMPGEDGLSACRRLAARGQPVVMLSAMGEETDRIVGLELGADDYLAKPCNPRDLLARVRAVLRRRDGSAPAGEGSDLAFAGWRLDLTRHALTAPDGGAVALTAGEFALLHALVRSPRRVLSRDQLLDAAFGQSSDSYDRAVDVQISRLRKKLGDGSGRHLIVTRRGEGYLFDAQVTR